MKHPRTNPLVDCASHLALAILLALLASTGSAQQIPVASSIGYEGTNSSNNIVLTWESIPTKLYNVLTTTALGPQPWLPLNPSAIYSSNNLVRYRDTNNQPARFYKIVKLDTDPPEIWRLNPGSNTTAVARQSPLKAWLRDETAIDPASIVLTVGTNPPATLADPRLAYTNNTLTYTPDTNQFLGTNAQMVTNRLIVADTLGRRATNSWSFQLELPPILASNAVIIASPSGGGFRPASDPSLTLVSINGDTYVFSYTGASSGLTDGQVLVSADPNAPYKRRILSLTDNPASHTVSVVTTQASLAECIQQGSVRISGAISLQSSIPLGGTVIYDNGTLRVEVIAGQITFNPDLTISGDINGHRLTAFDSEISGTLGLDMTLQATAQAMGDFDGSGPFPGTSPISTSILAGAIPLPPPFPPIPVYVEAVLELNIGYEAHLEATGTATWGFQSSRTLTIGATLRNGQWSHSEQQSSSFTSFPPSWEMNGSARVRGYLQPKLTLYLEPAGINLAGVSVDLKPYLELEGNACVQPGQAGVDLSLNAGLTSTLALDVRWWDKDWVSLPGPWEIFNLRTIPPLWHRNLALTTPVGSPPQTFGQMVWIPCGTFTMGSPASEPARDSYEGPQTWVTISHGFWMGKYEVKQSEYLAVMGVNPSFFKGDLNRPVETVSWNDCVAYCTALTTRERNAGRLPAGYVYRLPTEAEWEYACRAGTTTAFHYGDALRSGMANFYGPYEYPPCAGQAFPYGCYNRSGAYLGRTTSVGSYAPNAWGLYDMHGNVWEWCSDWWSASLPGGSVPDPQGPPSGSDRVFRGGGWGIIAFICRSAYRYGYYPAYRGNDGGFRVVLAPGQP